MIRRERSNSMEGAQAPSTVVVENPGLLTLQKVGSGCVVGPNQVLLLRLVFKTTTGNEIAYSYELFDEEEGSLWQEFKKLFAKHTSGTFIEIFKACVDEFIEQNAGRQVKVSFRFFNFKQNRNWLFPDTKPRFRFI